MAKTNQAPTVQIADTVKMVAVKAIEAMDKAYFAKGGVHDLETRLTERKEGKGGLAQFIFDLSVTAAKLAQANSATWIRAYFKEITKAAETGYKEAHADVTNIKDRLPVWPVFKSEINRAIDSGLNPKDFDCYGALKNARVAAEKKSRESTQMATGQRAEGEASAAAAGAGTNVAAALGESKVTPALAATLRVMQGAIAGMDAETQDKFANDLSKLIAKYGKELEPAKQETKQEQPKDGKAAVAA